MNLEIYTLHFLNYNNILLISIENIIGVFIFSPIISFSIASFVNTSFLNKNLVFVFSIYNYIFLISLIFIYAFFGIQIELTRSCTLFEYFFLFDNLSLLFTFIVLYIIPLCILYSSRLLTLSIRPVLSCIVASEIFVSPCFTSRNLFFFYIAFELTLIPIFILIYFYGSRTRRIYAATLFFIYTFVGSIFLLIGISYVLISFNTLSFDLFYYLETNRWSLHQQFAIFFLFFFGFAIKIPIMPFHSWLPEAHVEAPTIGSVILASILLKLGGYGFPRTLIPLLHDSILNFRIIPIVFCTVSCLFATYSAYHQFDIKKIIAYSSILHMNFSLIGLWVDSSLRLSGSIISMLSHSFTSAGLFFIAGFLYERFQTRNVLYYAHLYKSLNLFYLLIFFFILSNMSVPLTVSFLGELFISPGLGNRFPILLFVCGIIFFFAGLFGCLLLYNLIYVSHISHKEILQYVKLNDFKIFPVLCDSSFSHRFTQCELIILVFSILPLFILYIFPQLFIHTIENYIQILKC